MFGSILCSRFDSSPKCLIQRVEGINALLLGFLVASVRIVVGEVTMATHQWDEVTRLLMADQVQLQT